MAFADNSQYAQPVLPYLYGLGPAEHVLQSTILSSVSRVYYTTALQKSELLVNLPADL